MSLVEQLRRLAIPQTSLLKRDKKRASLLFNPKEAAGFRRETIYQIGLDGLEELIQKNQIFQQFKDNLFDLSSKNFERSVETEEANKKLNKVIRKFLLLLSPYFLLSCAHRALEWLINRFNIHEFNKEDLLMLILPYHESNIFVRVIQVMKFKDHNDNWHFLKSLQKPGIHLTKQNLLTRASADVHLIKFVARYISLLVKEFKDPALLTIPFNFYCTVFSGAIDNSHELSEAQITQMLPALVKGLNSDVPDYCAASYVILSRLVMKTVLTEIILDKFLEKISEVKVETLRNEAVLLLLVLYQSQYHYVKVPVKASENLVKKPWLLRVLQDLNRSGCLIWQFLSALVKSCVSLGLGADGEEQREFVLKVFDVVKFDDGYVGTFLSSLLDSIRPKKRYTEPQQQWLTEIIAALERQYPAQFDKEVYKILSSTQEGKITRRKKTLQKILKDTMTIKGKFDVFDKLYHPNPQFRIEAIKYLAVNYDSLRDSEKEMIKSSFLDRLNDDNVAVVAETLTLVKSTKILLTDDLKSVLICLSGKCQRDLDVWDEISSEVILLLCSISQADDWETFLAVFPYLLTNNEKQLTRARKITKTKFVSQNVLLAKLSRVECETLESEQFCNSVFDCLKNENFELVHKFVEALQKTPADKRDVLHKYLATLILSCILPDDCPMAVAVQVIEIFIKYFKSSDMKVDKSNAFFHHHVSSARQGKFHIEAFLLCLKNVIVKTRVSQEHLGRTDFFQDNSSTKYFSLVADVLFNKDVPNYAKYWQNFLRRFCKSFKIKISFMLNLILSNNLNLGDKFAVNCTDTVLSLVKNSARDTGYLGQKEECVTSYLLSLLLHKSQRVRLGVIKIIEIIVSAERSEFYNDLLTKILAQKEEIILDEEQLPLVIFNILSSRSLDDVKTSLIESACKPKYPIYVKDKLLKILSHINNIEIFNKTSKFAVGLLLSTNSLDPIKSSIISSNIARCDISIAQNITLDSNIWRFIETCLKGDQIVVSIAGKTTTPAVLILKHLTKDFVNNLKSNVQSKIYDILIETSTLTQNLEISPATNYIFKHVDLDAKLILSHFTDMRDVHSPKLDKNKLKRRISVIPTPDILDTLPWKKGVTTLEFIQDKKKIRNAHLLVAPLFEILKKCLDFDEQAAVEYPKQLVLSSILHCCQKCESDGNVLPKSAFNIEMVVACIRASTNPQSHHHALLVLAYSAAIIPSQVLNQVMVIFTFMGSSVLRRDDAYSYQIIAKIIDTIIPLLVKGDTVAKVLRVFVDALLDVPEHRRVPLYTQLLTKIGVEENLFVFLLLMFDSHINNNRKSVESGKRLQIAQEFAREFSPKTVIISCIKLIKHLKDLPEDISDEDSNKNLAYDIKFKTPKQFRHFKYTLVTFTANLLSSREFVGQVAGLNDNDLLSLEDLFKDFVINILTYIQRTSKVSEKNVNTPQSQYWKIILHHSYDILDSVNALLTPQMFLLVVKGLMTHSLGTVRRRALELLNAKLQHDANFFNDSERDEIYSLIPPLITIVKCIETAESSLDSEQELIIQTALLSMKLLTKMLATEYPEKFLEILEFVTDLIKNNRAQNNVLASLILCLAELCINLRAHSISSLPNSMPPLLKILRQQKHSDNPNLLLLSCITAIQKILDTLPLFLSPYLEKLLCELSLLTSKFGGSTDDQRLQPVVNKLCNIRRKVGSVIPPRVLIPVVELSYNKLIDKGCFNAIGCLMDVLGESLDNLKGFEIGASLNDLTNFFLSALQFRADNRASLDETNKVESQIVKALSKLILKLSESNFRPLYYKLFDWAVRSEVKSERVITFYALSSTIAENLKGLFVLFAGHFLNNAAQILVSCNAAKSGENVYFDDVEKTVLLLENVLKTLLAVFRYDNQKFVNKDRFKVLMQPLVDQLENTLGGVESLQRRNNLLLTPCIVQFTVATADDSLWVQLNQQIFCKMKHEESPQIRLVGLHCLTEIVKKLGEDFLPLLPDAIQVLWELLEDEDEDVEKAARRSVQDIEKIIGEPLQNYSRC